MDSVDLQVLKSARRLARSGPPRRARDRRQDVGLGAAADRRADWRYATTGMVVGSVSGGCVEDDMIERVRKRAARRRDKAGKTHLRRDRGGGAALRPAVRRHARARAGAAHRESGSTSCSTRVERHELVVRRLDMETGARRARARQMVGPARIRRRRAQTRARPALASAHHRRRPALEISRADGAGARLPGHGVRSARGIRRRVGRARRAARRAACPTTSCSR